MGTSSDKADQTLRFLQHSTMGPSTASGMLPGASPKNRKHWTPRRSTSGIIARLLLALLTLCLFFEIFRLWTSTEATPNTYLTHRRDTSEHHDILYERGTVGENIGNTVDHVVGKVKGVFYSSDDSEDAVNVVSEYAYDELNREIPRSELKAAFTILHNRFEHNGKKDATNDDWIREQIKTVIPELKSKYEDVKKAVSSSSVISSTPSGGIVRTSDSLQTFTTSTSIRASDLTPTLSAEKRTDQRPAAFDWQEEHSRAQAGSQIVDSAKFARNLKRCDSETSHVISKRGLPTLTEKNKRELSKAVKKAIAARSGGRCPLARNNDCDKFVQRSPSQSKSTAFDAVFALQESLDNCLELIFKTPACIIRYRKEPFRYYIEKVADFRVMEIIDSRSPVKRSAGDDVADALMQINEKRQLAVAGPMIGVWALEVIGPIVANKFVEVITKSMDGTTVPDDSGLPCPLSTNSCDNFLRPPTTSRLLSGGYQRYREKALRGCVKFVTAKPACISRYSETEALKPIIKELAEAGKVDAKHAKGVSVASDESDINAVGNGDGQYTSKSDGCGSTGYAEKRILHTRAESTSTLTGLTSAPSATLLSQTSVLDKREPKNIKPKPANNAKTTAKPAATTTRKTTAATAAKTSQTKSASASSKATSAPRVASSTSGTSKTTAKSSGTASKKSTGKPTSSKAAKSTSELESSEATATSSEDVLSTSDTAVAAATASSKPGMVNI